LIEKFGNAKAVYDTDIKDIIKCIDPRSSDRTRLSNKSLDRAYEIFGFCNSKKVGILTYDDVRYPNNLKKIPSPPVVLYHRGVLPDFNSGFYVSMVGTRAISDYGRKNAFKISYDLASMGATVVSGMAMGIDGISHAAALEAGKNTIAVLGSGIDVCYPSQHLTLARNIVKNGCIITEFPPHTPPARNNFPIRNRIISGLSELTIVIEGKEKSGARITAAYALEQGRALYALPGNIESDNSELTNLLLKNGAKIITSADDIARDYQDKYPGIVNPFNLSLKLPVNIMDTLTKYSVAATSPSDDIFPSPVQRKKKEVKAPEKKEANPIKIENDSTVKTEFDARTFNIYTKIPTSGDCSIESLVDGEYTLRDVMKCLLKLEMGHFITMLPGERVSRKSN
jgi:DNA processing protein